MDGGKALTRSWALLLCAALLFSFSPLAADADDWSDWFDRSVDCEMLTRDRYQPETDETHSNIYLYACDIGTLVLNGYARELSLDRSTVEVFEVSADHPFFSVRDGVLFSKDGETLIRYPNGRKAAHYDIPAGTRRIGERAFEDAETLVSVSFPLGLKEIGTAAFCRTALSSVTLPPTVERVDQYAFADCVLLSALSVSPGTELAANALDNCPLLSGSVCAGEEGGEPSGSESTRDGSSEENPWTYLAVANPKNAGDRVYLYTSTDGKNRLPGYDGFACGEEIGYLLPFDSEWYLLNLGGWVYDDALGKHVWRKEVGYVRRTEVTREPEETLFRVISARPKDDRVTLWELQEDGSRKKYLSYGEWKEQVKFDPDGLLEGPYEEANIRTALGDIGWCSCEYNNGGWVIYGYDFRLTDAVILRERTGDGRVFGLVAADAPENRVHLREKADRSSASLGKYFSGMQAEILSERGDWYRVRIGFDEGWMMKQYVLIAEQE